MDVKTKFKIGDEVYVVMEYDRDALVSKDTILEITINEDGISYYLENHEEYVYESQVFALDDKDGVLNEIKSILEDSDE